ncbi:MAG: diaminopimelate epimerase [Gemmatimonadetes bacterium]|nr:diaminopimelate epimerase [Gemmatimonadota bacterium]
MPELRFAKGQALGNDYLVVDAADLPWPLTPPRIRAFCDRHRGAGSDGILVAELARGIRLRIYNPDGSEAEKSGNGLRIFAAYLHGRGLVGQDWFEVELVRDRVRLRVERTLAGGVLDVAAEMGRPSFRGDDVGFRPVPGDVIEHELELAGGEKVRVHPVSLANPHCVVFPRELRREDFLRQAPQLATHAAFAAGTNVQFARVLGPDRLEAWIYERGAGETLASGSSACAVSAVAARLGLVAARRLTVEMPGGPVQIDLAADGMVQLRGPAQIVYFGGIAAGVVEEWGRL